MLVESLRAVARLVKCVVDTVLASIESTLLVISAGSVPTAG